MHLSRATLQICVQPEGRVVLASHGQTLLDCLLKNKIEVDHSCGGHGTCGTCRVFIQSKLSDLPPRNEIEQERADERQFAEAERLSCQLELNSNLTIQIPKRG